MDAIQDAVSLTCCCCGGDAGRWKQHWNRDSEYGICSACVAEEMAVSTAEEIESRYGKVNLNFDQPMARYNGRRYKVLAATRNKKAANNFISRTPNASALTVFDNGLIVIADSQDMGEAIE